MKTHHAEIILAKSGCTQTNTSQTINDFHTKIENAFYSSLARKKKFFFLLLLFLYDGSFCHATCAHAHTLSLSKITIAVKQKDHFNGIYARSPHSWLRIMNIKCNKFIILRERVKMPFLWLRVCHAIAIRVRFYSYFFFFCSVALIIL